MADYLQPETLNGPIVVGVDGSPFSRTALRWAIAEGRRSHSPVIALLVWRTHPVPHPSLTGSPLSVHETPDVRFQQLLDDIVRDVVAETGGPVPVTRAMPGSTGETLAEASDEARMLVLGSHGHGRVTTALVGSVAEYCIRNAVCPVVVIPAVITQGTADLARPTVLAPDALFPRPY
jgi:nucleotide-binding universal stress UspA family protein